MECLSGTASKPGDIIHSVASLTIEVISTNAEGRVVLCDDLAHALPFLSAAILDLATFMGACIHGPLQSGSVAIPSIRNWSNWTSQDNLLGLRDLWSDILPTLQTCPCGDSYLLQMPELTSRSGQGIGWLILIPENALSLLIEVLPVPIDCFSQPIFQLEMGFPSQLLASSCRAQILITDLVLGLIADIRHELRAHQVKY